MNNLEDLINEYNIEDYFQEKKDEVELSEEYKDKILTQTLKKLEEEKSQKVIQPRKIKVFRLSKMAAVFAAILFMSGMVLASVKEDGVFFDFLHVNNNKVKNSINNMSTTIEKEKKVNGYSVKLRECLSDNNVAYILFDITAPEGVKLDAMQYFFEKQSITVDGGGSMGYNSTELEDEDKDDNKIRIMYSLDHHKGVAGKNIKVDLENLSYCTDDSELITKANGSWEFEFSLDKNVECKRIWQFKKMQIDNRTYWITSMQISPISLTVDINRSIANLWQPGYLNTSDLMGQLEVTLETGEKVNIISEGVGTKGIGYSGSYLFEKALDLDQIKSIQYRGITFKYK